MSDLPKKSFLLRLWTRLTEPDASIREPEQRHQAQFLATTFLLVVPTGILGVALPAISAHKSLFAQESFYVYLCAVLVAGIAYYLSRTKWYQIAAWIAVLVSALVIFLAAFADQTSGNTQGLFYLIISVVLGGILLSIRATTIIAVCDIVGILILPVLFPGANWEANLVEPLAFNIIVSLVVILVAHHRDLAEQDRQNALEQRISTRTQELTRANESLKNEISERESAEKALANEHNLLRTLIDNLPDYIVVKDSQNRFVLVNKAWASHNTNSDQTDRVVGKTDHDYFSEDLANEFLADEQRLLQSGQALIDKEEINLHPGQIKRWMLTSKVPLRDGAGQVTGLVGISRDITQRKQMENSLQKAHDELEQRVVERTEALSQTNAELQLQVAERLQAEKQLRYQANLLQNITDAIIATDNGLIIQSWNQAAEQNYGWSAAEAIGKHVNKLLMATFPHQTSDEVHEDYIKQGYWRGEVTHTCKDGSTINILSSVTQMKDVAGETIGSVGVNRDITDHKLAEIAEREQRLLAEALRDTAAAINSTLDLQEVLDRILIQVERVVPYESATIMLIDADMARVVHCRGYIVDTFNPDDLLHLRFPVHETHNLQQMYETGQPYLVADTRQYAHWKHFDETEWIHSYIGAPIQSEGEVIGFINLDNSAAGAFSQPHAEKLQAFANQAAIALQNARLYDAVKDYASELEARVAERTAEVERQRAQLQTILDSMHEGVVGIMFGSDMRPQTRLMNRVMVRLTGYEPDEWDFNMLRSPNVSDAQAAEVVQDYHRTIEKVGIWQRYVKVRCKDGSEFDGELTVTRVNDLDGKMIGIVIVTRDVSQEKILQEQRSRFVANASHELRTPITNLLTRLYLLRKQPERLPEHLEILESVVGRMRDLVEDLLEHSRFERGVIPLRQKEIDLRLPIIDVIRLQEPEADAKQIQLSYRVAEQPVMAMVDPGRMIQVFTNLITNAINYTPDGGQVNIDCHSEINPESGAAMVVVRVRDSGIGILPDLLLNIFRPFYRGNEHTNGTGLGLSIAKEIVEMHGGTISVESEVDKGSCFTVRLALISPDLKLE
jgi:PAS domain S-box-containing protein